MRTDRVDAYRPIAGRWPAVDRVCARCKGWVASQDGAYTTVRVGLRGPWALSWLCPSCAVLFGRQDGSQQPVARDW